MWSRSRVSFLSSCNKSLTARNYNVLVCCVFSLNRTRRRTYVMKTLTYFFTSWPDRRCPAQSRIEKSTVSFSRIFQDLPNKSTWNVEFTIFIKTLIISKIEMCLILLIETWSMIKGPKSFTPCIPTTIFITCEVII